MKITKKTITAAKSTKKIPAPFDKYYHLISDKEVEDLTGVDASRPSPCEETKGYDVEFISYAAANEEYEDYLSNDGLDIVELVKLDGKNIKLCYVVGDRIYEVAESDLPEEDGLFDFYENESTVVKAIQKALNISSKDAKTVYGWYANEYAFDDFETLDEFIDYLEDDIYEMLDAADDEDTADRIREAIESSTNVSGKRVTASVDTGLEYWYLTKHGLGPGMMPGDVHLLDVVEDGWDTYILLDKMLTTDELNYFDIKEATPPAELLASCTVEGATAEELNKKFAEYTKKQNEVGKQLDDLQNTAKKKSGLFNKKKKVESAECKKVSEDSDGIHYVVGSEKERPWWIVDAPIPDDPSFNRRMMDLELADEADFYDRVHHEGEYEDDDYDYEADYNIEGKTDVEESDEKKDVECNTDINSINLDQLKADIVAGCEEYLTGPKGGFLPSGTPKQDKWDMTADEMYIVEVEKNSDNIKVEVRAELDFDGMINMSEILDDIIRKYDPNAYFDMEEPGIMDAYIFDNSVVSSTDINASREDDIFNERDKYLTNPPQDDYEEEEDLPDIVIDYDLDFFINVDKEGEWSESLEDENNSEEIDFPEDALKDEQVEEDSQDLLIWNIPSEAGKYHVKGHVHLVYKSEMNYFGEPKYVCDMKQSKITDIEVTPAGKFEGSIEPKEVESSTKVEAAMTDADVEDAILNGKPFDLESFKRFRGEDHEGELLASQLEVGDVFRINNADVVDYGTVLKVLNINDPETADPYFDYTFTCEVVEPADERSSSKVGDIQDIWFDSNEYVGTIIPV